MTDNQDFKYILATDCGSTTTKAILIEKTDGGYRLTCRGEAPTTVEEPLHDVTIGVKNAVREIEELTGRRMLDENGDIITGKKDEGTDIYLSTSSAGGGLQMTVCGVVGAMSAESAQRAALGAGAIVIDVIAVDDGRKPHERVERIRKLRPDMVLMSGGTDGGTVRHLVEMAEMIRSAKPRPRLGNGKLPIIYAGNKDAVKDVAEMLGDDVELRVVDNLRPTLERENLDPAAEAIHELFLRHVMQQAPGYDRLTQLVGADIMSTPNAVGYIIRTLASEADINVLAADIGGATTDVFSVFGGIYNRTVRANLGMSYSVCNVLAESGTENILRWVPTDVDKKELRNRLRNKMIRPTTIPQTLTDLLIEQAVAREALRLAFEHHKSLARALKGTQTERTMGDFPDGEAGDTIVNMNELDMIIGSGGVLSHAPNRAQAAYMLLDAYEPMGLTMLAVDSIFMMPQLGVTATVAKEAATEVLNRDCLIKLGMSVAPIGHCKKGEVMCALKVGGEVHEVKCGDIKVIPVPETAEVEVTPLRRCDVGAGKGKPVTFTAEKEWAVGIIVDCRTRPLILSKEDGERLAALKKWHEAFGLEVK
ncbi:MAG: glutamate mutase L [Abditibacteriota bacterium]|nr:glutamate mutase L [Abditibacteriota bacterium]